MNAIIALLAFTSFALSAFFARNIHRHYFIANKHENILKILNHFCDLAYQRVYDDQILAYATAGLQALPPEELETIQRNYVKLTMELMGEQVVNTMLQYFKTPHTMTLNMLMILDIKYKNDSLTELFSSVTNINKPPKQDKS